MVDNQKSESDNVHAAKKTLLQQINHTYQDPRLTLIDRQEIVKRLQDILDYMRQTANSR